jgi:thymidylate synthase
MNNIDKQYLSLLQDILVNGVKKEDRTGTGTLSVFGRQIRHKMSEGFPLLTTKKIHWNSVVVELLWFLRGETNIKFLLDYDCHIWDGDAYKRYKNVYDIESRESTYALEELHMLSNLTKEEFTNRIKADDKFAKKWGELGPIYGAQWRKWGDNFKQILNDDRTKVYNINTTGIDQIQNLINDLKTNPDSRRLMVNAWNVGELDQMVLPPCHYGFQVYTRELSLEERIELWYQQNQNKTGKRGMWEIDYVESYEGHKKLNSFNIPKRAISLMWNQRSVDTFLGLPFNIASYGLLLEIIAKEVNMIPDELIGNLGDVHLYSNHIEQAKEQIGRKYTHEERVELLKQSMGEENFNRVVDELMPFGGGLSEYYDLYKIPYTTREPFPLPSVTITERNWYQHELVKEHLGEKTFSEKILSYRPECFELIGYQSHPKIKARLSN